MIYKSLNRSSKEQENMEQENMEQENMENMEQENMEYSNIPPQTHDGLRETILSLEVKTRKGLGERGLVKISASWS